MFREIKDIFFKPSPAEVLRRQEEESKQHLIEHRTAILFSTKMAEYHEARLVMVKEVAQQVA